MIFDKWYTHVTQTPDLKYTTTVTPESSPMSFLQSILAPPWPQAITVPFFFSLQISITHEISLSLHLFLKERKRSMLYTPSYFWTQSKPGLNFKVRKNLMKLVRQPLFLLKLSRSSLPPWFGGFASSWLPNMKALGLHQTLFSPRATLSPQGPPAPPRC